MGYYCTTQPRLSFRQAVPPLSPPPPRLRRLCQAQPTRRGGRHFSHGCGLDMGVPGVGEVDREARRIFRSAVPFLPLPLRSSFCYPVWTNPHPLAVAGMPVKAALLLNYDPTGPSRLLPIV
uniref:Uncharacterized protein n=2 Tax=Aegilops tauschii subsp. strangulata TaxID=200361 RepID=A0A453IAD3_AEGTS